jgi:Ricin-type beta-trefoil lectin domain
MIQAGLRRFLAGLDYQLCQKLCQPLCQPPFPQPPFPQPPLPQPPLRQPPLRQPPPLPQPRRQRPQPPLPHQAGAAFASFTDGSLAEPDKLDTPSRISSSRVDTLAPAVVCAAGGALVAALASADPNARSTEAPKAPAGKITERVLRMRFLCVIIFLPNSESGGIQSQIPPKTTPIQKGSQLQFRGHDVRLSRGVTGGSYDFQYLSRTLKQVLRADIRSMMYEGRAVSDSPPHPGTYMSTTAVNTRVPMKKLTLVLISLLAVAASLTSCVTPRQISSGNTNMCMNVEWHGYPVAGTPLRVKPCDPWRNQQWILDKGQITGVGGFCVDVQGSVANDGAQVIYVPCSGAPSQQWMVANGTIIGLGGKCIDIGGTAPANWTPLVIAACTGSPSQQWQLH